VPRVHTQAEYVDAEDRIVAVVYDLGTWRVLVTAAHVAVLSEWPPPREAACLGELLATVREETTSVLWSGAGIGALFGAARLKSFEGESRSAPARPRVTPRLPRLLEALKGPEVVKYVGRRPWFTLHTSENTVFVSSSYAGYLEELGWSATAQGGIVSLEATDADFDRKYRAAVELQDIAVKMPVIGPNVSQLPAGFHRSALLVEPAGDASDSRRFHLRTSGISVTRPDLPTGTAASIRAAQEAFDARRPGIVIGVGSGAAAVLALDVGDTPIVLVAPAWRDWVPERRASQRTVILHSARDEAVPLADSVELARLSDLRPSSVRVVGASHAMVDPEALAALLVAVQEAFHRR
jgi:CTP:molybdopterin cytidylyltransferase MocA